MIKERKPDLIVVDKAAGFIDWTHMRTGGIRPRRVRKLMTMHNALHPKSEHRQARYLPRREGGRGLISAADAVTIVYNCRIRKL